MTERIASLLQTLTLAEKAALCSGLNNWETKAIERFDIPSLFLTDGPHGVRKEDGDGFGNSLPATCFPTASALASSWNPSLMEQVGKTLGIECQAQGVDVLLGPGVNMKRSPLNGRNFEYFSEDPFLAGKMVAAMIRGIQGQGVGTSLKHFAVNNQEFERMSINAEVDLRTLHEIYLPAFEIAVKEAQPWTIMAAYNRVNGTFASEDPFLLTEILDQAWHYEGIVVSDWSAVHDRVTSLKAGLHLEMPGNRGINDQKIVAAVQAGELSEALLDHRVARLLTIILKAAESSKPQTSFDLKAHHEMARKVAGECIVLLKNEHDLLPLRAEKTPKIAVIGQFAKESRYQGGGSSLVNPTLLSHAWDELQLLGSAFSFSYAEGYGIEASPDPDRISTAIDMAKEADVAVLFVGLPDDFESEGIDRSHLAIPAAHHDLIEAVAAVQPQTVVVLYNGAPITMPWLEEVSAVVEGWLGGQAIGGAIADVLLGKVNPSGKLAETFPARLEDTPTYLNWPGYNGTVRYGEGMFIGYRYYDTKNVQPLFPFGFGLSYTHFSLDKLQVANKQIHESEELSFTVEVKNEGDVAGHLVAQVYVHEHESALFSPVKALRAFQKVFLQPGEQQTLSFSLDRRAFAYFDEKVNNWVVKAGKFDLLVGTDAATILAQSTISVTADTRTVRNLTSYSLLKDFLTVPEVSELLQPKIDALINQMVGTIPSDQAKRRKKVEQFFTYIMHDLPLYKLPQQTNGAVSEAEVDQILSITTL